MVSGQSNRKAQHTTTHTIECSATTPIITNVGRTGKTGHGTPPPLSIVVEDTVRKRVLANETTTTEKTRRVGRRRAKKREETVDGREGEKN